MKPCGRTETVMGICVLCVVLVGSVGIMTPWANGDVLWDCQSVNTCQQTGVNCNNQGKCDAGVLCSGPAKAYTGNSLVGLFQPGSCTDYKVVAQVYCYSTWQCVNSNRREYVCDHSSYYCRSMTNANCSECNTDSNSQSDNYQSYYQCENCD
jgi:hypothetical protein